jgi:acyl-CoA thioesterase II
MHDLEEASRVEGAAGVYRGQVSDHWSIWMPNGGYLSSMALRAAAAESRFSRPASYQCQFLSVAKPAPVDLAVETLRKGSSAEAFSITMSQDGKEIMRSLLWLVDRELQGLRHDRVPLPDVPGPDALDNTEKLVGSPGSPLFHNIERRPVDVIPLDVATGEPIDRTWMRFRPRASYDDVLLDSMRALVTCDLMYWPAIANGYDYTKLDVIAPGLDLSVRFHRSMPATPWLYCETRADIAEQGLLGSTCRLWSEDGQLLASSATQAMFRPMRK